MTALICLEKFSDWLEAYSIFCYFKNISSVRMLYIENVRNNRNAVENLFENYKKTIIFSYRGVDDRQAFFKCISEEMRDLNKEDIFAAPFIRYREIWTCVSEARKRGVVTVHLSESLPDSFGRLGYRLGFRLVGGFNIKGLLKQLISMPIMYFFAKRHEPDICFYNMADYLPNPFVKTTIKAAVPVCDNRKKTFLKSLVGEEKRPLLISGFGYNLEKMVKHLTVEKYIATSKDKEIIIDGKVYPLDEFICAEEVLLSGYVNRIIGYNSTAMCWAMMLGNIEIECYESRKLSELYGFLNGYLSRKTLKKCNVVMLPECKEMVD